jgi:ABC-type multidrug transport system fused ATPase/permease subunit
MLALIITGIYRGYSGHELAPLSAPIKVDQTAGGSLLSAPAGFAFFYLMLRGFAEGCAAMTGTEAISNGISAFKAPAPRNASITLVWMVAILATFFMGTSALAQHYHVMPTTEQTVLSQLGHHIFGTHLLYYLLQYATFAVLVLAANTAFADFPRLAGILANDRFMPRQFSARGDRLAFSNGIITLALIAMALVALFHGDTNALVPLYAIGVFVCFTLSQAGMVVHWAKSKARGWRKRALLNGIGAIATAVVSLIQVVTKFTSGGWIVALIIPVIILLLRKIHRHYEEFAREIHFDGQSPITPLHHTVIVPIHGITRAVAGALVYATAISDDVLAAYVEVDKRETAELERAWTEWDIGVPLVVLPSPYRSVLRPLVDYVENLRMITPGELVTVVVPEVVPRRWWEHFLHNKTALYIRTAFLFKPNVVVTSVPYLLGHSYRRRDLLDHDEDLDESDSMPRIAFRGSGPRRVVGG